MQAPTDLAALERAAYRSYWSDGIIDIYTGVSMLFVGAMWTWVNDLSGIAGVLPAIFVAPMLATRKRFVETRLGHVEWRPARRGWERRNLLLVLAAGIGMLALGIAGYLAADLGPGGLRQAPGIMAWLLALLALGLALVMDARRLVLYAVVLAASGVVVVLLEAEPGWPMLVTGAVATLVGLSMLRRFIATHPVMRDQ